LAKAKRQMQTMAVTDTARQRLLSEALRAFSRNGYDGASTRAIADAAGVNHSLIAYHFGSKDGLWRAAMSDVLASFESARLDKMGAREGLSVSETLRLLIRDFVTFCADRPEFHRILTAEWAHGAERIQWLGKMHILPLSKTMIALISAAQSEHKVVPGDPVRLHYAVLGIAATAFAMAPEYALLTGQSPVSAVGISQTVSLIERLVFTDHSTAAIGR
jgi:AcrR family transcriptional regulator